MVLKVFAYFLHFQFSNIFVGIAAVTKEKGLGIYGELAKVAIEGLVGQSGTLQKLEKAGIKALSNEKLTANEREDRVKATKKLLTFDFFSFFIFLTSKEIEELKTFNAKKNM